MVKGLIKYSLFLSIVLVVGYSVMSISYQASSTIDIRVDSKAALQIFLPDFVPSVQSQPIQPTKRNLTLYAELLEVEESELLTSKKYIVISKYFNNHQEPQRIDFFNQLSANGLPSWKPSDQLLSYTPLNIKFEVFRI